ncbi:hypothetical protein D3C73_445470 [compost metagenome]
MLSLGGKIVLEKDERNRPIEADFVTREGWFLDGSGLKEFQSLKTKGFVSSRNGGDYVISKDGLKALSSTRKPANAGA